MCVCMCLTLCVRVCLNVFVLEDKPWNKVSVLCGGFIHTTTFFFSLFLSLEQVHEMTEASLQLELNPFFHGIDGLALKNIRVHTAKRFEVHCVYIEAAEIWFFFILFSFLRLFTLWCYFFLCVFRNTPALCTFISEWNQIYPSIFWSSFSDTVWRRQRRQDSNVWSWRLSSECIWSRGSGV